MKTRTAVILFAVAFLLRPMLQVFLPGWLTLDFTLCLYIALAISMDVEDIVGHTIAAFIFVTLNDMIFSQYIGVTGIAMIIASAFIFLVRLRIDVENVLLDGVVMMVAFVIFHSVYWLIYRLLGTPYSFLYMLARLPKLLIVEYVITGIIVYLIVRLRVQKRRNEYFK